jgi:phage baseplate assembly protein W
MTTSITGFAFPFRFDPSGGVATQSGDDKLKENIVHLLLTSTGERVMRRSFGGGLRQILHDPNNDALRAIVQHQLAKAISAFEPRVAVQDVTVAPDPDDGATLNVSVLFIVRRTRQMQSVSVPIDLGGI